MMDVISGYRKLGKFVLVFGLLVSPVQAQEPVTWKANPQFLGRVPLNEELEVLTFLAAKSFFLDDYAEILLQFETKFPNKLLDLTIEDFTAEHLETGLLFSDSVKIERQNISSVVISGVKLPCSGEWMLRFHIKLGNEKKLATIKVKI